MCKGILFFRRLPQERTKFLGYQAREKGDVSGEKAVKNGLFQLWAGRRSWTQRQRPTRSPICESRAPDPGCPAHDPRWPAQILVLRSDPRRGRCAGFASPLRLTSKSWRIRGALKKSKIISLQTPFRGTWFRRELLEVESYNSYGKYFYV
jgi:hypothetical protein